MKTISLLGTAILLTLTFAATATASDEASDVFPIYCPTAHWTGGLTDCKCPSNTYMRNISFRMNGDGEKLTPTLGCSALLNIRTTGPTEAGNEVVWPNTGQQATAKCDQNNLMTGYYLVNNGSKFKFTPLCTPVDGLTSKSVSGNEADTHNTGDVGTSRCPTNSLARGLWGINNYSTVFHFAIQCWEEAQ